MRKLKKKDKNFYSFSVKDKIDPMMGSSNLLNLLEQDDQQKNLVKKAKEDAAVSAFALDFIVNPSEKTTISDETGSQISSASEGAGSQISSANEGISEDLIQKEKEYKGLTTYSQILKIFCNVFDLPETMPYFPLSKILKICRAVKKLLVFRIFRTKVLQKL